MNIRVLGKRTLEGTITPSGNKNAVVALIPATILFTDPVTLSNIPDIPDVHKLVAILESLGGKVDWDVEGSKMIIDNSGLTPGNINSETAGGMRGTILLWGSLISRFGSVEVPAKSGGCTLGIRPLGPQFDAFRDMGVIVEADDSGTRFDGSKLKAREVWLSEMSPTITENIIMLATGLSGVTKIVGAASEPHVQDLCNFLVKAGANISGIGSSVLEIEGGHSLSATEFAVSSDHHEITTFLALAAITKGRVEIPNAIPHHFPQILKRFERFGLKVKYDGDTAIMNGDQRIVIPPTFEGPPSSLKAGPWPGFPVDLLPLFIPIALAADEGKIIFHNWMYENGLAWVQELIKMGADVHMSDPHRVLVSGGRQLKGATLEAPYIIRAVIAMLMAALIAEGETTILNADAMYRAHPRFIENLRMLGAEIEEV